MSLARLFLQRIALGVLAVWGVLSAIFVLFVMTRHWGIEQQIGQAQWGGEDMSAEEEQAQLDAYLAERDLDGPLWEQYLNWVGDMFLLDWGESFETGEAVLPLVMDATVRTMAYVLPAIALAIALGALVGLYAAMNPDSRLANGSVGTAYLLFALPNFYVGGMLLSYASVGSIPESELLFGYGLPIVLTATSLLGGYVTFSRAHALEYTTAEFVTHLKAKGASRVRIAIHVVRNGAIPLFSMLFTEALALLVLTVFVIESLFAIDGLGLALFVAIESRDLPVLLGGTMVIIVLGVIGNIVQDISYTTLDPRVDTDSR